MVQKMASFLDTDSFVDTCKQKSSENEEEDVYFSPLCQTIDKNSKSQMDNDATEACVNIQNEEMETSMESKNKEDDVCFVDVTEACVNLKNEEIETSIKIHDEFSKPEFIKKKVKCLGCNKKFVSIPCHFRGEAGNACKLKYSVEELQNLGASTEIQDEFSKPESIKKKVICLGCNKEFVSLLCHFRGEAGNACKLKYSVEELQSLGTSMEIQNEFSKLEFLKKKVVCLGCNKEFVSLPCHFRGDAGNTCKLKYSEEELHDLSDETKPPFIKEETDDDDDDTDLFMNIKNEEVDEEDDSCFSKPELEKKKVICLGCNKEFGSLLRHFRGELGNICKLKYSEEELQILYDAVKPAFIKKKVTCVGCNKEFGSLPRHFRGEAGNSCRQMYSEEELQRLSDEITISRMIYQKQYRKQNKEKCDSYQKQYQRQYQKQYQKEYQRQYRKQNKEKLYNYQKQYNTLYQKQNKEKLKNYQKQYQKQYFQNRTEESEDTFNLNPHIDNMEGAEDTSTTEIKQEIEDQDFHFSAIKIEPDVECKVELVEPTYEVDSEPKDRNFVFVTSADVKTEIVEDVKSEIVDDIAVDVHSETQTERLKPSTVNYVERKSYECGTCGEHFEKLTKFTTHLKTHGAWEKAWEKSLLCDVCEKPFDTLANLNRHRRSHKIFEKSLSTKMLEDCLVRFTENGLKMDVGSEEQNSNREAYMESIGYKKRKHENQTENDKRSYNSNFEEQNSNREAYMQSMGYNKRKQENENEIDNDNMSYNSNDSVDEKDDKSDIIYKPKKKKSYYKKKRSNVIELPEGTDKQQYLLALEAALKNKKKIA